MERYVYLVLFASAAATLQAPSESKKYRDDYTYDEQTNSFYKMHAEAVVYRVASDACQAEGAALVVPSSIQVLSVVHGMFKEFPDIGEYLWLGDDGEVHESAEEEAIIKMPSEFEFQPNIYNREYLFNNDRDKCSVLTRDGEIQEAKCSVRSAFTTTELPFACKVDAASAPYDTKCGVYAKGYVYNDTIGNCYKISNKALSWNQAYSECASEGAHLVVLNSKAESLLVKRMMSAHPLLRDAFSPYYYIAGMRLNEAASNANNRVFQSIFNQTLEAEGFAEWADTEPNNVSGNENCGSLFEGDGKYNDQQCAKPYGFICEVEIQGGANN